MRRPCPGDQYRVAICTTSDSRIGRDVIVAVERAEPLRCGCVRITTTRPGPDDGELMSKMQLHVQRCEWHTANGWDGTTEPERVTVDA